MNDNKVNNGPRLTSSSESGIGNKHMRSVLPSSQLGNNPVIEKNISSLEDD